MDLNLPDFARLDHRQHAAVGAAAGGLALGALYAWDPDASLPERIVFPIAVALAMGLAKEAYDYTRPESHCCELGDALATGLGGAAVSAGVAIGEGVRLAVTGSTDEVRVDLMASF